MTPVQLPSLPEPWQLSSFMQADLPNKQKLLCNYNQTQVLAVPVMIECCTRAEAHGQNGHLLFILNAQEDAVSYSAEALMQDCNLQTAVELAPTASCKHCE